MIQQSHDGVFRSTLLDSFPKIVHGFTIKRHGNMKQVLTRRLFMEHQHIHPDLSVSQEQIHGAIIHRVIPTEFGIMAQDTDGLIYKHEDHIPHPSLIVRVGDCVPLLLFDPKIQIIGVAHAGWKGTVQHIAKKMIHSFIDLGSDVKDVFVIMGPSICQKCYEVADDVIIQFQKEYATNRHIIQKTEHAGTVDLIEANVQDCTDSGMESSHIDFDKRLCTYENKELFYSWRRKNEPFGEIMGYIGYTA